MAPNTQAHAPKLNSNNQTMYKLDNGDVYSGLLLNGKKHGKGSYLFTNGNKYVGDWFNDQMSGNGIFYFANVRIIHFELLKL
jgi:hypothetical protein